jgi:hypothetical protein
LGYSIAIGDALYGWGATDISRQCATFAVAMTLPPLINPG